MDLPGLGKLYIGGDLVLSIAEKFIWRSLLDCMLFF